MLLVVCSHRTKSKTDVSPFNELFLKRISGDFNVLVLYPRNFNIRRPLFRSFFFNGYRVLEASIFINPNVLSSRFFSIINKLSVRIAYLYICKILNIKIELVHQIGYFTRIGIQFARLIKKRCILQIIGSDIDNSQNFPLHDSKGVFLTGNSNYSLSFSNGNDSKVIYRGLNLHNDVYNISCSTAENVFPSILFAGGFPLKSHQIEGVQPYDYKGGISLLNVFNRLSGYILHITGPNAHHAEKYYNKESGNNVIIHDYLKHPDLLKLLSGVDIVIIPSYSEGISNVAMEAMLFKKIVISRNVGGMGELIANQYDGILFDSNEELSLIMEKILKLERKQFEEYKLKIGNNAHKKIVERFNNDVMISEYATLYRNLSE